MSRNTRWQAIVGSVRGHSHLQTHAPNQDAGKTAALKNGGVVLAAADGHGDPLHARSQRGSSFAVEAVSEIPGRVAPGGTSVEPAFELVDEGLGARIDPTRPATVRAYVPARDVAAV